MDKPHDPGEMMSCRFIGCRFITSPGKKDTDADMFILALTQSDHTSKDFNRICNMLSEYGSQENSSGATLAYLEEHCDIILAADAVQQLAQI